MPDISFVNAPPPSAPYRGTGNMGITFSRRENGDVQATLNGYYHAIGPMKDRAVKNLAMFLQEAHPDIWHQNKQAFVDYFGPSQEPQP